MKTTVLMLLVLGAVLVQADEKLYDDALAKKAVAVVRVEGKRPVWELPHFPMTRYHVHVIHVFKNESNLPIADCDVHAFKGRDGVPPGECTIYIERYDTGAMKFGGTNGMIWILVGGDATNGVSHVGSKANLR
jgi:hypothetical protein